MDYFVELTDNRNGARLLIRTEHIIYIRVAGPKDDRAALILSSDRTVEVAESADEVIAAIKATVL